MSNTNNSKNSSSGTITIGSSASSGGNINWIPTTPQYITVTVPTGTQQQFTITGIDWAVPVEEKENKSDGCSCKKCEEFFEFAEPNQEDGTLICWACRHGY